jgi:hypothetical protein
VHDASPGLRIAIAIAIIIITIITSSLLFIFGI